MAILLDRALEIGGEHDLDGVLHRIVQGAAAVAGARYAALGVYGADGLLTKFVHHGVDGEAVARIGDAPVGRGLLGEAIVTDRPIRVTDISGDARSCGFPAQHPHMHSFLGAPIARGGRRFGNLYLADKIDAEEFDDDDEALVVTLAAFAASAIEHTTLVASERARVEAVAGQVAAEERERARHELLAAVISAQEIERARVSRDLHDDIGQALTSVMLGLRLIEEPLHHATGGTADAERRMAELRQLVAGALDRTRRLAFELRPTVLDDLGLAPALARLATDTAERSGLRVDAVVDAAPQHAELSPEIATAVYRVVQEALTNVVRHAEATTASVAVTVGNGRLRALIEDDGHGFDSSQPVGDHLGLRGMRERAELVGGSIAIASEPGAGTTVILEVPIV